MTMVQQGLALELLRELIAIPSVNPGLVPGASGETRIARRICEIMGDWGFDVFEREVAQGRHNAVAILRGRGGGRSLLFNGHIDTVSAEGLYAPYAPVEREGRLYGRGAFDMKGGVAAMLSAAHAIATGGRERRGDVVFTFVADEEHASVGTEAIVDEIASGALPRPDAAINTEPTDLKICLAHKGFAWAEIETHGVAAHGSRPDLGVDAIAHMGRILFEVERLQERLSSGGGHPVLGTGSAHASLIEGGRELSTYPDRCTLRLERRTVPPESQATVRQELDEIIGHLSVADPAFQAEARVQLVRSPWEMDPATEIANALTLAVSYVLGRPAETMAMTGWLDIALLADAGIPSVVFGAGGGGAHALVEWAEIDTLDPCAQVYVELIERFCG